MTESFHEVSTADVAKYVAELNSLDERNVEKILVRQISPRSYAVQCWFTGERDYEGYILQLDDTSDED